MGAINKILLETTTALVRAGKVVAEHNELNSLSKVGSLETKAGDSFVSSVLGKLTRNDILTKYCLKNNLEMEYVQQEIAKAEDLLGTHFVDRLLKLTNEEQIKLIDKPKIFLKKKSFDISAFEKDCEINFHQRPILSTLSPINKVGDKQYRSIEDRANLLKQLLHFEEQGKIPANRILSIMDLEKSILTESWEPGIGQLISAIKEGTVNSKNIDQTIMLLKEYYPINLIIKKDLESLTTEELKKLREILAAKGTNRKASAGLREQGFRDMICEVNTPLLPILREDRVNVLSQVVKKLTSLVKVNKVSNSISRKFLNNFDKITTDLKNAKPIRDLQKAGGINLKYSRESFKSNIMSKIEHLPKSEQNVILNKFGLNADGNIMTGLPVLQTKTSNLSKIETEINAEINKFLNQNEIILPSGFGEYKTILEEICKTFPEFRFTIGLQQHRTQAYRLAEHMLSVFKANLENPLYKNLNSSDRKVLGISTLLHDINKTEKTVDKMHPFASSESVNSIVQRMKDLTVSEKDRIINFVNNHHWLEQITEGSQFDDKIVKKLALKFRYGNDFTMAKIFAESDLKGVNDEFFKSYGAKINSSMTKAIEDQIFNIQKRGYNLFTSDITLEKAIRKGAKKRVIGTGSEATENYVIKAKDLGLDSEHFLYHAPATDDAFMMAQSGFGYGNEGVFSLSLGKNGNVSTFQNRKEFWGFRQPEKGNVLFASKGNGNTGAGKDYTFQKCLLEHPECDFAFSHTIKGKYQDISGKILSDTEYAELYKESASIKNLGSVHKDKKIIKILGGEEEAKAFEKAIRETQDLYLQETGSKEACEFVAQDLEPAFIGTKRSANEISCNVRKLSKLIVEFD